MPACLTKPATYWPVFETTVAETVGATVSKDAAAVNAFAPSVAELVSLASENPAADPTMRATATIPTSGSLYRRRIRNLIPAARPGGVRLEEPDREKETDERSQHGDDARRDTEEGQEQAGERHVERHDTGHDRRGNERGVGLSVRIAARLEPGAPSTSTTRVTRCVTTAPLGSAIVTTSPGWIRPSAGACSMRSEPIGIVGDMDPPLTMTTR